MYACDSKNMLSPIVKVKNFRGGLCRPVSPIAVDRRIIMFRLPENWRARPEYLLMLMAAAMPLSFWAWMVLLNNFTIEVASFTGREIGILQSLREVPGFLSFLVVYVLLIIAEQRLALFSLILLGLGVALTGYFPTAIGLYITTVISSIGFHYYEA